MKIALALTLVLLIALFAVVRADIWQSCAQPGDVLTLTSITVNPDPPVIGQDLTIAVNGTLASDVTSGTVHASVTLDGATLLDQDFDLCSFSSAIQCPFKAGPFNVAQTFNIPPYAPSGEYSGQFIIDDQNGKEVTCIKFDFSM
eukprot:GEZU01029245.1.p2 GENE.GEZU01029245.1~~GEZU01029245.1.p2  ORF type:complete len:144 (+),score=40.14 GEZU01029245.1:54-485(+)